MIMGASQKGVAALDPVDEAVFHQKIEGPVDRDRRGTRHRFGYFLNNFIGAERTMTGQKSLQNPPADRREFLPSIAADTLGVRNRSLSALAVVMVGFGEN